MLTQIKVSKLLHTPGGTMANQLIEIIDVFVIECMKLEHNNKGGWRA
jgi:hypothetical protein